MRTVGLIIPLLLTTNALYAQSKSQRTLWPNGLNAAAYTNMGVEQSTVHDRQILSAKLLIGMQVYRYEELFSICLGYGKSGFYDGIEDLSGEDTKFQFNYQGPNLSFELFPNGRISGEFIYWIHPDGNGVRKLSTEETNNSTEGDYRVRYSYKVEELGFSVNFRIWSNIQASVGLGSRNLNWTSKITRDDETVTDIDINEANSGNESSTYITVGIRGSQLINFF